MSKLTKKQARNHEKAMFYLDNRDQYVKDHGLDDFIEFFIENYNESATVTNSKLGAFFTPLGLAEYLAFEAQTPGNTLDLCAGIGILSYAIQNMHCQRLKWESDFFPNKSKYVCVEKNKEYFEIGKKLFPDFIWINGDVFDPDIIAEIKSHGRFDYIVSNPPYGKVKHDFGYNGLYTGAEFEYKIIEHAKNFGGYGVFLIPQMSSPFIYSSSPKSSWPYPEKYKQFSKQTGINLDFNTGFDTGDFIDQWHGVKPITEIVTVEY